MKILLDENLPKKLKRDFPEDDIYTVSDKNWNGRKNGELLALMSTEKFDVFITFDQNIAYQQNLARNPIAVIILIAKSNSYEVLSELLPKIKFEMSKPLTSGIIKIS